MSFTIDHHFTCAGCNARTPFDRRTWTIEREYDVTKPPLCIDCAKKVWRYDSEKTEYTSIPGEPHIIARNLLASESARNYPNAEERAALNQPISFPGVYRPDENGKWIEHAPLQMDRVRGVNERQALRDLSNCKIDLARPLVASDDSKKG